MGDRNRRAEQTLLDMISEQRAMPARIDAAMQSLLDQGYSQGDLHRLTGLSRQEISRRIVRHQCRPQEARDPVLVPR